ncbi:exosortase/archaeosortase family protein [Methanoplanus sp. FWC-SCC4]|uniref:Exosortase/archaeosortase family protein n=1 Tax=Methanochimaera problematica TaxID=2609417 RepID=A0AA97FC59_9EURY|nr:exosortase/archaeosortase family protein [Methanoplanus sp. FWC-SCC4]WOF16357.1 exosortase/archaeosortase family protein [Methanoplanus sp. FWC-SCC4]
MESENMKIMHLREISPEKAAWIWVISVLTSLTLYFIFTTLTYLKMDAIIIWALSCVSMIYLSRKEQSIIDHGKQKLYLMGGIFVCLFSFLNIPLGLGNPPYSIGEFSILLSGISIIIFSLLKLKKLIIPALFPLLAVFGFEIYELFLRNQEWIIEPLIPPTIYFTNLVLNIIGINPEIDGNIISFLSTSGEHIYLAIVTDCTGIWSLGTFTIAAIIVLFTFPEAISKKSALLIFIGYIGTYISNIGRITLISLSGYLYGPKGVIEHVHVHIGWILFTIWMIVFWYYFFRHHLHYSISETSSDKYI